MTPLPRWVFLASLLGSAVFLEAHPTIDACVYFCRSQRRTEIAGACNYYRQSLQSSRDQAPIHRLFRLCLTPCSEPDRSGGQSVFDDSQFCRSFRDFMIVLQDCTCDSNSYERTINIEAWNEISWLERLQKDFEDKLNQSSVKDRLSIVLKKIFEPEAIALSDDEETEREDGLSLNDLDLLRKIVQEKMKVDDKEKMDGEESEEVVVDADGLKATTVDADMSDEYTVDWDMWCMDQCDNGQGGSACRCDLIP